MFQRRFRGILCDKKSYLLELVRYIHLQKLGRTAGVTTEELCHPNKGSRRQCNIREQLLHVATRIMLRIRICL